MHLYFPDELEPSSSVVVVMQRSLWTLVVVVMSMLILGMVAVFIAFV